jgi:hypothetical protein
MRRKRERRDDRAVDAEDYRMIPFSSPTIATTWPG